MKMRSYPRDSYVLSTVTTISPVSLINSVNDKTYTDEDDILFVLTKKPESLSIQIVPQFFKPSDIQCEKLPVGVEQVWVVDTGTSLYEYLTDPTNPNAIPAI